MIEVCSIGVLEWSVCRELGEAFDRRPDDPFGVDSLVFGEGSGRQHVVECGDQEQVRWRWWIAA